MPRVDSTTSSVSPGVTAYLDDIVAVVVPADHPEVAQALATGALQYRDGRPPVPEAATPRDTFDLVRDFDAFDLSEVTDWANLPNVTPVESPLGGKLFDQIRNVIDWERRQTLLYDQYGTAFETAEDLDAYLSENDNLYLVLAVGYRLSSSE
ncbi:MAG: hypothetical protein ACOCPX_01105 [Halapricum sp.]